MWEKDKCTFTDVTVGLWRIKQVMHELSPTFQSVAQEQSHGREVMLVPTPGSAHNLGLFMVSEFFRRSGWRVSGELLSQTSDMLHVVLARPPLSQGQMHRASPRPMTLKPGLPRTS